MTDDPQAERYRTPEVEAVQWTGDNADQMRAFCSPFDFQEIEPEDRVEDPDQTAAMRESAHGTWRGLAPGDWAVRRGNDFFEVPAADFARQYEPAVPPAPADRAELRQRIADVLAEVDGWRWVTDFDKARSSAYRGYLSRADAVLGVLPEPADRAAIIAEILPAWEAVYEPGSVSDYLIGYANDEAPAKAAAEAWMRSQAEVTGRLEWVPDEQLATGRYDQWFELIERHDDGIDTGPGLVVRRRTQHPTT